MKKIKLTKIIGILLAVVLVFTVTASMPVTAQSQTLYGDANIDGKIDIKDLLTIKKHIVKIKVSINTQNADVNRDSKVDAKDMLIIKKYIVAIYSFEDLQNGDFSIGSISVDFVDVGQADCAVISCGGEYMMIDGGNVADSSLVYSYLEKRKITTLKYMICTHAHEDHVGGLSGALNYAKVGTAYCPVTTYTTKAFKNFVTNLAAQNKKITVPKVGDKISLGGAVITFLAPVKSDYSDINNTSIVVKIVFGSVSFLFTGDAENEAERDIQATGADLSATVLKVGHHGSATSSSIEFLKAVKPEYAVISVGANNSYNHPNSGTISRILSVGAKLYRTDENGMVSCTSNGKTVTFTTEK